MKKITLVILTHLVCLSCFSQKPTILFGDPIKVKKGTIDVSLLGIDTSGIYVTEAHTEMSSYFVFGATFKGASSLIKFNNELKEVYRSDFDEELKGKDFETFYFLKGKLFLLATHYDRKALNYTLFGTEVDVANGKVAKPWQTLASFSKDDKSERILFKTDYNADSSRMVLASTIITEEGEKYIIQQFDNNLNPIGKQVATINNAQPANYKFTDMICYNNGNIAMIASEYESDENARKNTVGRFKNYNIRIYTAAGKLIKEIIPGIKGKRLWGFNCQPMKDTEIVCTGFYSTEEQRGKIDALWMQRTAISTGATISLCNKPVNESLVTNKTAIIESSDDKKKKKDMEDVIANQQKNPFLNNLTVRQCYETAGDCIVVIAEKFGDNLYSSSSTWASASGNNYLHSSTTYDVKYTGDIVCIKIDNSNEIKWMSVLPRAQWETNVDNYSFGSGFQSPYFGPKSNWPFYTGIGFMRDSSSIKLLFNDAAQNAQVTAAGQFCSAYTTSDKKGDCFLVNLDLNTGNFSRSFLFSNSDRPPVMPRFAAVNNRVLYMIGKESKALGKTKLTLTRLQF